MATGKELGPKKTRSNSAKNIPMLRLAQRFTLSFKVRDRKLIKIGTANMIDIPNNNSLVMGTAEIPATISFNAAGSCKRVESPCKPLNIRAAHNADSFIFTSFIIQSISSWNKPDQTV